MVKNLPKGTSPKYTTPFHYYVFSISKPSSPPNSSSFKPSRNKPVINTITTTNLITLLLFILFLLSFLLSHPSIFISNTSTSALQNTISMVPRPPYALILGNVNVSQQEMEFWRQPDGLGYKPCLQFSIGYRRASAKIVKERRRFLVVKVSGGLNQQRNQIVDAVVFARILGAALVLPILKFNVIWQDNSEFSDIFDVDHFIRTLHSDIRIVSRVPPTHKIPRPSSTIHSSIPSNLSPLWIRSRFLKQLDEDGVLVLEGLESKLSKDLPLDLQKLRCKVAFHALKFIRPILELGKKLAERAGNGGPYIALHLRLEEDVWIRTGCSPGLGQPYDDLVAQRRTARPDLLTGKLNMTHHHRKLSGLCPLNTKTLTMVLRALGAERDARVYWAGGKPLGGELALKALKDEFPKLMSKYTLAVDGELEIYENKSSVLAALDYIVALNSDVFVPSHGGNMGLAMMGHRAYVGHRKSVRPNKRGLAAMEIEEEAEFGEMVRRMHKGLMGEPELRTRKTGRDVIAFPVPECMCR
ncbi:GDP-fucose protein O-fucosyltransferase protein [Dioscorea alata]|uniref:GDP-fucose protein O-fucosyltransferase protein n=1 Tax=Dioscorea alata TaxID=55571 RepID=A0ACB7WAD6_DIOAL|nr:GDP-fucose protein O-fucosyltransferase protein [Dioscorea alata]